MSDEDEVHHLEVHVQIGEVSERTGLSLRTIRYYEEVGLLRPSMRSPGGFRLYTRSDIGRLGLVRRMKTLGFSIEEMRDLLVVLDVLGGEGPGGATAVARADRAELVDRLVMYLQVAEQRVAAIRAELDTAEGFAASLREEVDREQIGPGAHP